MTLTRLFLSISAVLLLFSSCTMDEEELLGFRNTQSAFTVRFPASCGDTVSGDSDSGDSGYRNPGYEEVVCDAVLEDCLTDASLKMTVVLPERSEGISVTCTADSCTVSAYGVRIPLSAEASRSLMDFFVILASETPSDLPLRSSDGSGTLLHTEKGTLVLDENLLPCAVEYAGMDGEMRTAVIENFSSIINSDNTEHGAD